MDIEQLRTIVNEAHCKTRAMELLGLTLNGAGSKKFDQLVEQHDLDILHFDSHAKTRKYAHVVKICPVCKKEFETQVGHPKEKTVCSHSCSNTHFRNGDSHPQRRKKIERIENGEQTYAEICWSHHKKECIVCGETLVVEAHHYNEDHEDNRPENFVPLCPTHHRYWHSRHRHLIEDKVHSYVANHLAVA